MSRLEEIEQEFLRTIGFLHHPKSATSFVADITARYLDELKSGNWDLEFGESTGRRR